MGADAPVLSIVIPARNAEQDLEQCLTAIQSSGRDDVEVIVVDDASTDGTREVVGKFGCRLEKLSQQSGPAAARNKGAGVSRARIVLFIDSDILVDDKTVPLILESLAADAGTAAVVGMLDERTPCKNICSQYFNLRKHYDYLSFSGDLTNLYTSITAIRKDVFMEAGGFNESYARASVEDAELGRRLCGLGYRIALNRDIRVRHVKQHSILSLTASDFRRAASFMKLVIRERLAGNIVRERKFASFRTGSLGTVFLAPVTLGALFSVPFCRWGPLALCLCVAMSMLANRGFLRFTGAVLGWKKNIVLPFVILADSLAVAAGIVFGSVGFLLGSRY